MRKKLQRIAASALVLGLTASLTFGAVYTPAYAQAENGILTDVGEGENRVLSTELRTLNPGQQVTYQFAYDGEEQPINVLMNSIPAGGATFQVWTDDRLAELDEDSDTEPLGRGTSMAEGSSFTNWQGGSLEAETYYVVVTAEGTTPSSFLLTISSPALSAEQPGALAIEPVTPTTPVDPNIAVVTTDALNVRSGPSTAFAVLTTITNGAEMTVLGRNAANTWLNVQLADGTEGWVTRSLTSYTLVSPNVVAPALLPGAAASVANSVTATNTATTTVTATSTTTDTAVATTTPITPTETMTATELGEGWQVLGAGEVDWYMLQYRGGDLPMTLWMDVEPFGDASFTVVNQETAMAIMAGSSPTLNTVGRGRANPTEPGYLYWQAEFAEADTYYVMVMPATSADGDVLYSLNALGPGVGRAIEAVE